MGTTGSSAVQPSSDNKNGLRDTPCGEEQPDTSNACNNPGDTIDLSGFCTTSGIDGDSYRRTWCAAKGSDGEWIASGQGATCTYNNCTMYNNMNNPVCCIGTSGCCSIVGN